MKIPPRAVSEALRGYGASGVVEVWLVTTPGGPFALVVANGEDTTQDDRVRRRLALVGVSRVTFVPAEVGVVVPHCVRVVPDPAPDNRVEVATARGAAYVRELERLGIALHEEPEMLTPDEEAEELRRLGLR